MVRLKDIAERAGVSIMTVSKVLHDAQDISVETKTRVRALAQQMGYVPDTMARSLRSRVSQTFGVVVPTITHPAFSRIVMALEEKAFEAGFELLMAHTLGLAEREESVIRRLLARRVDGLFIAPVYRLSPHAPVYQEIQQQKTPVVILGAKAPFCQNLANVETDEVAASANLCRHLISLGHKRIGFLAGPAVSPIAQERIEGYRRALHEANLETDDRLIFDAGMTVEEGAKAAEQMLKESAAPTALVGVNDFVAIGAAEILLKNGRRIPEDISVAGFGNFMVAEYYRVPLTTTFQPKYRLGLAAFEIMKALWLGKPPETRRLPCELALRLSTGAPRA